MKRRIIFNNLQANRYDSVDDMFEDVPIKDIDNTKMEKDKESGCFAGFFVRFFHFFTKQ